MERLVHYIFGLVFAAGGLLALPGDGQANEGFGERVAGTYFVEQSTGSFRVITLNSDGGLSAIESSQGGSLIEGVEFTSQHMAAEWRASPDRHGDRLRPGSRYHRGHHRRHL
jgi:hypothetical protein